MAQQLDWWVVASKPLPPEGIGAQIAGGQTAPPGSKVVSTVPGSPEDNAFMGQRDQPSGGTAYKGMYAIFGPFTSEADAKAALSTPAPGLTSAIPGAGAVKDVTQGLAKIGAFLEALTHGDTWRSVGWILAGLILVVVGIRVWLGKPVLPKAPSVVPVPV